MKTILTITLNPSVDKSSQVLNVIGERKLRCEAPHYEPGGGGINVSRAIKKLGGESIAFHNSGGIPGEMLNHFLDVEGIHHCTEPINEWTRVNFTVTEISSNRQFRFNMPGPKLSKSEWEKCLHRIESIEPFPDYIVASGSLPQGVSDDFYARVARIAKKRNSKMILDTSGKPLELTLKQGVFLLKLNLRELKDLASHEMEDDAAQKAAIEKIIDSNQSEVVLLSLGQAGAVVATADKCQRFQAPTVPIRSKVGAGDSMVGGVVLALAREKSLEEAVLYGMAAGSAAVLTPGTGLCERKDVERLFTSMR